jgi:hypothetical protein
MMSLGTWCHAQQLAFANYTASPQPANSSTAPTAFLSTPSQGNSSQESGSFWPRPYAYGGLALSRGAGYDPAAGILGSGLDIDARNFLFLGEGSLQNAHKIDSGTGSEYDLKARSFVRAGSGWFCGGGVQWSRLSTSEYAKQAWRPTFGGGKDLNLQNLSVRAQALYIMPGTDHLNALQGPEISLWLPSPASRTHFFYRQTVGIYEFHQTSVPGNPGTNLRSASAFVNLTAMYRF